MAAGRLLASILVVVVIAGCGGVTAAQPPTVQGGDPGALAAPVSAVASPRGSQPVARAAAPSAGPASPGGSPPAGPFTIDLYRRGIYAMQATWWWCTAATIEMMRNILLHQVDHSTADQQRYFDYAHAHDSYSMPASEGVDLVGLQAGLRHYAGSRYTLSASSTYEAAVRIAVTRLRLTGEPVVLVVDGGRHVWLMTGFTATADPARGPGFRISSVNIVGPLYGRQSSNGYDPPPDTRLSYDALRRFLLPYHFKFGPTPWDHRFVVYGA